MNFPRLVRGVSGMAMAAVPILLVSVTSLQAAVPVQVPEPVSISLLGLGLAGIAGKRWMDNRRKK